MIAYKFFNKQEGTFRPWYYEVRNIIEAYNPEYIIQRPIGCGPFACFKSVECAEAWLSGGAGDNSEVLYKVRIKKSRSIRLWIGMKRNRYPLPDGSILADEFEILEEVK